MAIGFSLTIMLVMYTLYQGVIQNLPKTAYLKFIDIWLLFCLIVPSVVFLVEVMWELRHVKNLAKAQKLKFFKKGYVGSEISHDSDQPKIPNQRLIRLSIIFLTVAFIVIYCLVAAYFLNNPSYEMTYTF